MGFLDSFKKIFEPAKPPVMEPRRVQYDWGAMRLPEGWQFTQADHRSLGAQGPGGASMTITIRSVVGALSADEQKKKNFIQAMAGMVRDASARITETPGTQIWVEAAPVQDVLRIAVFRFAARTPDAARPPLLEVACTARDGAAFEQVRSALRSIEWS